MGVSMVFLIATVAAVGGAHAAGSCSSDAAGNGEWRSYGHDLLNTRSQPDEHLIDATRAQALAPKWVVPLASAGMTGTVQSTPLVVGDCLFVVTDTAWVGAFNADTGDLAWKMHLPITAKGYSGNVGSPAFDNGHLFVVGNEKDRKSTRLNSSHQIISYAVFCLKKK